LSTYREYSRVIRTISYVSDLGRDQNIRLRHIKNGWKFDRDSYRKIKLRVREFVDSCTPEEWNVDE
jgi:hypothetical protein